MAIDDFDAPAAAQEAEVSAADEIYEQTVRWLAERGCEDCVPEAVLRRYAAASARWQQCEEHITRFGLLIRTGANKAAQSPYVAMAQAYYNQANKLWFDIADYTAESGQQKLF